MKIKKCKLMCFLMVICVSSFVLYTLIQRYWLSAVERRLVALIQSRDVNFPSVRLVDIFQNHYADSEDYTLVCVIGPYQSQVQKSVRENGLSSLSGMVSESSVEKINRFLAVNNIRSGEGEWNILLLSSDGLVRMVSIEIRHIRLSINQGNVQSCVSYTDAKFKKVKLSNYPYGYGVALIGATKGE